MFCPLMRKQEKSYSLKSVNLILYLNPVTDSSRFSHLLDECSQRLSINLLQSCSHFIICNILKKIISINEIT
jgi:hypothetical protein